MERLETIVPGVRVHRIQLPIDPNESLARGRIVWPRVRGYGQTAMQAPGNEQPAWRWVDMRQPAARAKSRLSKTFGYRRPGRRQEWRRGTQECVRHG